jgi:hypothetical protein
MDAIGDSVNTGTGQGEVVPALYLMVNTSGSNTGGSARSHTQPGISLGIYYQDVRGLRTKQLELYENVSSTDYNITRI